MNEIQLELFPEPKKEQEGTFDVRLSHNGKCIFRGNLCNQIVNYGNNLRLNYTFYKDGNISVEIVE